MRVGTIVDLYDTPRISRGVSFGFADYATANAAQAWMLKQNANVRSERFKFLVARDGPGGVDVRADYRRVMFANVYAMDAEDAAGTLRRWLAGQMSAEQHQVMEPFVSPDVAVPRDLAPDGAPPMYIVYITFRTVDLALLAADLASENVLASAQYCSKHHSTHMDVVTVKTNLPVEQMARCDSCGKYTRGNCSCDVNIISVQNEYEPINTRAFRCLSEDLCAIERTWGSSWRAGVNHPKQWGTFRVHRRPGLLETLEKYVEWGYITQYYVGKGMRSPGIARCNHCGTRDQSCLDAGPMHIEAHEAGDERRCPLHKEADPGLRRKAGWMRRAPKLQVPLPERRFDDAGPTTRSHTGARLAGKVKWYDSGKKFGFITPEDRSEDVFVHQAALGRGVSLSSGQLVTFTITAQSKPGKSREATNVVTVDGRGSTRAPRRRVLPHTTTTTSGDECWISVGGRTANQPRRNPKPGPHTLAARRTPSSRDETSRNPFEAIATSSGDGADDEDTSDTCGSPPPSPPATVPPRRKGRGGRRKNKKKRWKPGREEQTRPSTNLSTARRSVTPPAPHTRARTPSQRSASVPPAHRPLNGNVDVQAAAHVPHDRARVLADLTPAAPLPHHTPPPSTPPVTGTSRP